MTKVDVISSCLVRMATNGDRVAIPATLELTPWDLIFLLVDPIQKGLLFYKQDRSQQLARTFIDHLKNSLSRALALFPLLSGRLGTITHDDDNTMSFFIDCNDAGAEFTHAAAAAVSVSDILEPKYTPEIVASLFPLNGILNHEGVSKPLLGVQVTELVDGIFIGCTANHVVMDGASFWHFFNSWSEMSRGSDTVAKAPVLDRWFPRSIPTENRLIHLPPLDLNPPHDIVPPPLRERVFHFSKDSLAKLKDKANSEAGVNNISTVQALSAHLWRSVTRSHSKVDDPSKQEVHLDVFVGARARIPLPDGYFGNAIHVAQTAINEDELLQNGLGFAALKINEMLSQQTGEAAIKWVEDYVERPFMLRKGPVYFVIISGSPWFDIYGCDFGWGKPIAAKGGRGQKVDGKMALDPAAGESGGIDVVACLAPEVMKAVEDDAEFMEAVHS